MAKPWVLQAAVFSALRRIFRRSPMYNQALKQAKREVRITGKTKDNIRRIKFKCAICGELFDKKEVDCDHVKPVIPLEGLPILNGLPDCNVYIARLFCSVDNLQVLCKQCHKVKSKQENQERKRLKDEQSGKVKKAPAKHNGRKRPKAKRSASKSTRKPRR